MHPNQKETDTANEKWFYWYFAINDASGKKITFHFNQKHIMTTRGPAISKDHGETWHWMFTQSKDTTSFSYAFKKDENHVRFSMGMPYTEKDFKQFIHSYKDRSLISLDTLCRTKEDRLVEKLVLGTNPHSRYLVVLTARHHACEMMANYVLEGMIAELMSESTAADWLTTHARFIIIPFIDKDGVQNGEQGKNRIPHDHNRDYIQEIYPSITALKDLVEQHKSYQSLIGIDIHCPWIKYGWNEKIFMVGSEDSINLEEQVKYASYIDEEDLGPFRFDTNFIFPYGKAWNSTTLQESRQKGLLSFKKYLCTLDKTLLSTTFEIPYAVHCGKKITPGRLKIVGSGMMNALYEYLKKE
jgi:hypothetical protein